MSITADIGLRALAILFPPACVSCHEIEGVTSLPLGLCTACRGRLRTVERAQEDFIRVGKRPIHVFSRWWFEPPFDAVIHALKFSRLEYLGGDLADGLHRLISDNAKEIDVVVPIPLHWTRLRSRGFNQAEAVARPLAGLLGLPLVRALRRRRMTRAQATLDRSARRENLRLAFAPVRKRPASIAERRILLVDDVVTTGATLEAATRSLLDCGAKTVVCAAAGRTPLSGVRSPLRGTREG